MGNGCAKTTDALIQSSTVLTKDMIEMQETVMQIWKVIRAMHVLMQDLVEENHTVLLALQTRGLEGGAYFSDSQTTEPDNEREPRTPDEGVCVDVRSDELSGQGHKDIDQ